MLRIAFDIGGTFTDVVARRPDGALVSHKLLSENPERYADAEDYRARVQAAAEALVQAGYLLPEDVATCEQIALERYGALTS